MDKELDFSYCECGCKGYSASKKILGETLHYWIFWDLKDKYYLRLGHGWFYGEWANLGIFNSYEGAIKEATAHALASAKKAQAS
jgi:hypothetical protein